MSTDVAGVNNLGIVAGTGTTNTTGNAFLWYQGKFQVVRFPGAVATFFGDVNDSGGLCGFYTDTAGASHGFSRDPSGFHSLDFPGSTLTLALGINSKGRIVGEYQDAAGVTHGFLAVPQ